MGKQRKMKAFGWKRKSSGNLVKSTVLGLVEDTEENDSNIVSVLNEASHAAAKKRCIPLSDKDVAKSDCLVEEGSALAEKGKCWDAIRKWDTALLITPSKSKIHEMKAQVLMIVGESFSAVKCAEEAVRLDPCWWVAHQTHGRALLNLGEVKKGLRSFCKAAHLNPDEKDLWDEDIQWAKSLLERREKAEDAAATAAAAEQEQNSSAQLLEMSDKDLEEFIKTMPGPHLCSSKSFTRSHCGSLSPKGEKNKQTENSDQFLITSEAHMTHISRNYVFWRDQV